MANLPKFIGMMTTKKVDLSFKVFGEESEDTESDQLGVDVLSSLHYIDEV